MKNTLRPVTYVRAWRESKNLKQTELAALAGLIQETVSLHEQPNPPKAHPGTLKALAGAMGLRVEQLYWPPEGNSCQKGSGTAEKGRK